MTKRIIGIILFVIGVILLFGSKYIMEQVVIGKEKLENAQKKVNEGSGLFNFNPVVKQIGKSATGEAQKKIDAGSAEVAYYEQMAGWLQIGGVVLLIVGTGVVFIHKKKK